MNLPLTKIFVFLWIGLIGAPALWASPEPIAFQLYSVESGKELSAQAVADSPDLFSAPQTFVNLGYDRRVHWLRFKLDLKHPQVLSQRFWFPHQFDLYHLHQGRAIPVHSTGSLTPLSQRPIPNKDLLFPIEPEGPAEYLIRAEGDQWMVFELQLWDWSDLLRSQNLERSIFMALFGGVLLVVFYQLTLFFESKDPLFLSYSAYLLIAGFILFVHSGLSRELLWTDSTWAPAWASGLCFVAGAAAMLLFTRLLLNTQKKLPRLDPWLWIGYLPIALYGFAPFMSTGGFEQLAVNYLGLINFLTLVLALLCFPKNPGLTLRFLSGWIFLLFGGTSVILLSHALIPLNDVTFYGVYFGAFFQLGFFSFAVSGRFGELRRSSEKAQAELLQATKRHAGELEARITARTLELSLANRRLLKLNREQGEFLQIAAHDLKTPLNAIGGFSELLQAADVSLAERQEYARYISDSANNLGELVHNLLDVQKIEESTAQLPLKLLDPADAVDETLRRYGLLAKGKGITLQLKVQRGLLIKAHNEWLQEVLANLTSNALKFSPKGGQVLIELAESKGQVELAVSDNGPGISPPEQEGLFAKFARGTAQSTGGESSSGLGLYIVKKMTDAMGGQVLVQSQPGQGAKFSLRFALERAAG
ncbi:MAG: sensor histidine kinase [bacterium]|nr:sensor histidine kinase [bacterium]